jgi:hypothetical protein
VAKVNKELTDEEKLEQELARKQELKDIGKILETPHGLRFFRRFFDTAMVFSQVFTGNSTTFFNDGKRVLGLVFMKDIAENYPEAMVKIMKMQFEEN